MPSDRVIIDNVTHAFRDKNGEHVKVIHDFAASFSLGEIVSLVGPSGCGKTTLLNIIAGIITPTVGVAKLFGCEPRTAIEKGLLSFIFQEPALLPWRTVRENISLPLEIRRDHQHAERVDKLIETVLLSEFDRNFPDELSGGMKSRVSLARALVTQPSLLLMDEPFGALDETTSRIMSSEVLKLWQIYSPTIVMVTHNISHAVFISDRVIVLSPRPAKVSGSFQIELSRPRNDETFDDERYFVAMKQIRHCLDSSFYQGQRTM